MSMTIEASGFANGEPIPQKFTGEGQDVSPRLFWKGVPQVARELALICEDPDAPTPQPWVHWLIYNLPVGVSEFPESVAREKQIQNPMAACQGRNSFTDGQNIGYRGPMPPRGHGVHHYHFKLFALDAPLNLEPGTDKATLLKAMSGHVLETAEVIGTYERK